MLLRRFIRNAFFVAVCLPVPAEFAYAQDTATVPEAPDIYFLAHNDGKVFLMWQPGSDGGSPILKYQIQQKSGTDSFGGWEDIPDSGPNTARHTVENLQNGTTYTFEVRAVNEIGEGAAAQVEGRPRAPVWQLTLSSYTVIEGDPEGTTAQVRITGGARFPENLTVRLEFAGSPVTGSSRLLGEGGTDAVVIQRFFAAGDLKLTVPDDEIDTGTITGTLTAILDGTEIARSLEVTVLDDDVPEPELTLTVSPSEVAEGGSATVAVAHANYRRFDTDQTVALVAAGPSGFPGDAEPGEDFALSVDGETLSPTFRPMQRGGWTGPEDVAHWELTLPAEASSVTATVAVRDDDAAEGQEWIFFTALHDGAIVGSREEIAIPANDLRPEPVSAQIDGNVVRLTFNRELKHVTDPIIHYPSNLHFSLYSGANSPVFGENGGSQPPPDQYADTFSLSGRQVELTFAEPVAAGETVWVIYHQLSIYAPLGNADPNGYGVRSFIMEATNNTAAKAVAASQPPGLAPNAPNPFNSTTQISYRLATPGSVQLDIYDVLGQPVRTLVDQVQAPGFYQVPWDARDQQGAVVATGVYLTCLHYPGGVQTRQLLYLK